jgi:hypothetical protein
MPRFDAARPLSLNIVQGPTCMCKTTVQDLEDVILLAVLSMCNIKAIILGQWSSYMLHIGPLYRAGNIRIRFGAECPYFGGTSLQYTGRPKMSPEAPCGQYHSTLPSQWFLAPASLYAYWPLPHQVAQIPLRRKRALWSVLYSARENSITDIRHMNNCRINEISIKLKQ